MSPSQPIDMINGVSNLDMRKFEPFLMEDVDQEGIVCRSTFLGVLLFVILFLLIFTIAISENNSVLKHWWNQIKFVSFERTLQMTEENYSYFVFHFVVEIFLFDM